MKFNTSQRNHREPHRRRTHREFYDADSDDYDPIPRQKYPRSDRHHHSPRTRMPSWLTGQSSGKHPQFASQRPSARPFSYSHQPVNNVQRNNGTPPNKRHSRIYVGNLPSFLRLPNDAYKELFTALYATAFGSLEVGKATPVDSFWTHKCGIYGFLQMRGPKEAVNVMLFNGLILHGRKLTLSRPSGYRPEIKNLNADEYVPDHVNGDRIEALVQAMSGIIAVPTERSYLAATQQVNSNKLTQSDSKTGSACGEDEHPSKDDERAPKNGKRKGFSDNAIGKVAVLVDIVKTFNLEDKTQYEELLLDVEAECNNFGIVKNVVIPKMGSWKGSVLVEFESTDDARKTVIAMRKRGFENKEIEAYVVDKCDTAEQALKKLSMESQKLNDEEDW